MDSHSRTDRMEAEHSSPTPLDLSIVMPCLNERQTLPVCIDKAWGSLQALGLRGEIVVADNGSSDGSIEMAREHGARVIPVAEPGYGAALQAGIAAARGRWVIMGDCDDSYDFSELGGFVERLRAGEDLVMGNRFMGRIKPRAMPWMHRYLGNPILTRIGRLFFKSRCGDFYCGLRGFDRQAIVDLNLQTPGMEFALEMLVKASMAKLRVSEVATTLWPDGRARGRQPHLRTWRDGWRSLRFYLLYSPKWVFWYPGWALIVVGLAVGLWLIGGPRTVAGVTFDAHTLAFAAAAVALGVQGVLFGVLTKFLAVNTALHPPNTKLDRFASHVVLEHGLLAGLALVLAGLGAAIGAVVYWGGQSFGQLNYSHTMRIVIPAILAICLGVQIAFASFQLGVFQLQRRASTRN